MATQRNDHVRDWANMGEQVGTTAARVKSFIERAEKLAEEQKALADDLKEVFAQAKSEGFDVRGLKDVIKLRKMAADERVQRMQLVELYLSAMGEPKQGMLPL